MKRRKEDQEDARLWDDEYESGAYQDETCDGYERNPGESRYYYNSYDSHSQYDTQQYDGYDDGEDEDVRRQKPRYYYDRKKRLAFAASRNPSNDFLTSCIPQKASPSFLRPSLR